ncbi:hypothetical protein [Vibrio sp.]|uniref:hypothetical protein n=1 Tax=Vibrio sp. TaxID=678 RepID=UPI003D0C34AD
MKKSLLALIIAATSAGAMAADVQEEKVNYGDPTASFSMLGGAVNKDKVQLNTMYGMGEHIFQGDLGYSTDKDTPSDKKFDYRVRYFNVTDGLGFSADVLGNADKTTAMGGMIYKFDLTPQAMVFPMLSLGRQFVHDGADKSTHVGLNSDSNVAQVGVYAMYAFEAGHWLYANPKTTYVFEAEENINQVEVGGGYMVADAASVGFKVEYTGEIKGTAKNGIGAGNTQKEDTVFWLNAATYF